MTAGVNLHSCAHPDAAARLGRAAEAAGFDSLWVADHVVLPDPPLPERFRRAVTQGHGWYGYGLDVPTTERFVRALRDAAGKHARPPELGPLEISVTPPSPEIPDAKTVEAYAAAGVDRLILRLKPDLDAAALERFAAEAGRALIR